MAGADVRGLILDRATSRKSNLSPFLLEYNPVSHGLELVPLHQRITHNMMDLLHGKLECGIEYGIAPLPSRHVVSFQIMVLAGSGLEPEAKLGLARVFEETLDKGTELHTGREISDAFDAIGAVHGSGSGLETTTFSCTVLPEHFERAVELHAEILRKPTFPQDAFEINVNLARQELKALEDDAQALLDKLISRKAYGPILGRHPLGEDETLNALTREDLLDHWKKHYSAGRMLVSVAGAVEPTRVTGVFEQCFTGFGSKSAEGRSPFTVQFAPSVTHHAKDLEQEQIGICWPGVGVTHDDFHVQQVMLGILSGGMSGRLFTEVREKLGLVYWVSAWQENPRGAGMLFLGASTTPQRCDKTFDTLLIEVERLADDLEQEELERAITGIVVSTETRGDQTGAHCRELSNDLFHYGHPVPIEEKIRRVEAVTIEDVKRFLAAYPRDRLCVVALGPKALGGA